MIIVVIIDSSCTFVSMFVYLPTHGNRLILPKNRYDVVMIEVEIAMRTPDLPPIISSPYRINPTRIGLNTYLITNINRVRAMHSHVPFSSL